MRLTELLGLLANDTSNWPLLYRIVKKQGDSGSVMRLVLTIKYMNNG